MGLGLCYVWKTEAEIHVISKLKTLLENYINVRHTGGNFVNKINVIKKQQQ